MKGEKMRGFAVVLRLIMAVTLIAAFAQISRAAEIKFPTPGYEGEELAKVREWEKTWVGKKVGVTNIDQVKDLLVEPVYIIMKNPQDFGGSGGDDYWFEVVPYRAYNISKGVIENTLKYAPQAKLDEKRYLVDYGKVAGYPFPNTKDNGDEMAWNFDANTKGDSHKETAYPAANVDCKSKMERVAGHIRWELYWTGRCNIPPTPAVEKNPKNIRRSFFMRMTDPVDFRDTAMLEIIYNAPERPEDLWIYMSMFRRIRRVAVKQRTDMIDGTDMIYDDQDGWYTHVTHNNYKYVGRKELLTCRHQNIKVLKHIKGQGWYNGLQRERVNTYVLEVKHEDPSYVYSKQIWYLDPETWQMDAKVMYDKEGRLWKVMDVFYDEVPGYGGAKTATIIADTTTDIIRKHSGTSIRVNEFTGKPIPENIFTVGNMQKFSY
jgi:hypothetical protein